MSWADVVKSNLKNNNNLDNSNNYIVLKYNNTINVKTKTIDDSHNCNLEFDEEKFNKCTKKTSSKNIIKIVRYRTEHNLTQREFAKALNIPFSDVKNAETGKEIDKHICSAILNFIGNNK